ncbi:MAG: hypothetical protein K0S88_1808, partial [Actinomycetia bacterium]|nr:hypothetical protein [Actinomycetes bacterium]
AVEGGEAGGAKDLFDIEAAGCGGREHWHEAHPIREHVGGEGGLATGPDSLRL